MSKKKSCRNGVKFGGQCIKVGDEVYGGPGIINLKEKLNKKGLTLKIRSGGILNTKTGQFHTVYTVVKKRRK